MNQTYDSQMYLSNAVTTLTEFVSQSTGAVGTIVYIEDFDFHSVSFEVIEEFELYLMTNTECFTGRIAVDEYDSFVVNNIDRYHHLCDDLQQFEQSSSEVLNECKTTISKFALAQFSSQRREISVHHNQHRIVHHCTCHICAGDGAIGCPSCDTTQYEQCYSCGGHGNHTCHHCGGCGYQIEVAYERDSRGESVRREMVVSCYCNGGRNTCSSCGGCGETPCTTCSNGYVSCTNCDSTGWISEVFSVSTRANYEISHRDTTGSVFDRINCLSNQFIDNLGFQPLSADHAQLLDRVFVIDKKQTTIGLISHFAAPSITLCTTVAHGDHRQNATVEIFGAKYFLLDADNILGPTVTCRSLDLARLRKGLRNTFHDQSRRTLYDAIAQMLSLPIVQKIFMLHSEDQAKSYETISKLVQSSVAPDLIEKMIADTKTLFAFINLRRFTLVTLGSLLGYILIGLSLFFNQRVHHLESVFSKLGENIVFNFTTITYFPCVLLVILVCENFLNSRRMKQVFCNQYLLARQIQSIATLGAFHSRFFIALLTFLVVFFLAL